MTAKIVESLALTPPSYGVYMYFSETVLKSLKYFRWGLNQSFQVVLPTS